MDYVVGSVAALISGNVTPNRPKLKHRALTPTKHPSSPHTTPKSEFVEDRSVFLSPSVMKKKAILKKSPKRIFENLENEEVIDPSSPKVKKVKRHLKDLAGEPDQSLSPQTSDDKLDKSTDQSQEQSLKINDSQVTPKSKKNKRNKKNNETNDELLNNTYESKVSKSPKKLKMNHDNPNENTSNMEKPSKKNKKHSKKSKNINSFQNDGGDQTQNEPNIPKKTKKMRKAELKQKKSTQESESIINQNDSESESDETKAKNVANPNAITEKDSDSEHESDNEIESENEQENAKLLTNDDKQESSDEEEEVGKKEIKTNKPKAESANSGPLKETEEEIKRTLFVGNVPFSKKCKKEMKKIFNQYGQIETIRIRTVPVKDARATPKLAIIKNEIHPKRSTVNVYIRFASAESTIKALAENNTVHNGNHLRVSQASSTGAEHDPRCAVFVGNLSYTMEDEQLRSIFEKCGEIESVRIIRDKKTNVGKGFGYVNFTSKDGVELALSLSEEDLTVKNRILRVSRCSQGKGAQKTHGKPGRFQNKGQRLDDTGAARRIVNKRKYQEYSNARNGPPNKKQNINQPHGEKKAKKEFVGMTAEKKKKRKFDKTEKKKKALREILMSKKE